MKQTYKYSFVALSVIVSGLVTTAQTVENWDNVPVLMNAYGHKISQDGSFSVGEAIDAQSAWGRDNVSGEVYFYYACSTGDGNCITKDNVVVGTDKVYMKAALMLPKKDADPVLVSSLTKYSESYAHGITWDGTRLVGIVYNPNSSDLDEIDPDKQTETYLPVVVNVDPDNNFTAEDPIILPTPPKDFFGLRPQYCTAEWISDDGTVVLGQVIDNSGHFAYPIVYTEQSNGEWAYALPSEPLFNPDNAPIPEFPVPAVKQPNPVNYIGNEEFKKLYQEMWDALLNGESDVNPDELLNPAVAGPDALMTEQEWKEYSQALNEYKLYFETEYEEELNEYYEEYSKFIALSTNFLQSSMAMTQDGKMFSQTKVTNRFSGNTPIAYRNPILFNLTTNTYKMYGDNLCQFEVSQILPDGTLIALTPQPSSNTPDLSPQRTYVCAPGSEEFVAIDEYIKANNPEYYAWYQEYLFHNVEIGYDQLGQVVSQEMTVSGLVAVSDDFTSLSGGVDGWSYDYETGDWFTYFFSNLTAPAAVESIEAEGMNGYKVYNLQGVKVLESKSELNLNQLPKGVYIINGKKHLVK